MQTSPPSPSSTPSMYMPMEICENIIDMLHALFSNRISDKVDSLAALHNCALVSRAWRIRAQKVLFYSIHLSDLTSLHALSTTLDCGPHLRLYVHEVVLISYHLHTTASTLSLFPALFAGRLPNLESIGVNHLSAADTWYPTNKKPDLPAKARTLPYILFMRASPRSTTFRAFSEFARMLHGLPSLNALSCHSVRWITSGSHPGADRAKEPGYWAAGRRTPPPFAPKLQRLKLCDIAVDGADLLVSTRGPHLRWLYLTIPLSESLAELSHGGQIDLSLCERLETLSLMLGPAFSLDKHAAFVEALLLSWRPQRTKPILTFFPDLYSRFTRRDFADVLRTLGAIVEKSLGAVKEASSSAQASEGARPLYRVSIVLHDRETEEQWWWAHVRQCFPTWARAKRLRMHSLPPPDRTYEWAAEEQRPQPDLVPHVPLLEGVDAGAQS
ncbi:hypothetical protein GSI_08319 [Ganoderma sinense ZZ0214-1]|uniref:F-box domain-containing protein n=1 Tax=Ganoderma sinense ZZ0214-1 TaxID=1077348 RepID=A0A2G8S6X8_9APHY|nr:hypothetical protein GSI_08319 [Ganoderma sinense ZZ0214-1]